MDIYERLIALRTRMEAKGLLFADSSLSVGFSNTRPYSISMGYHIDPTKTGAWGYDDDKKFYENKETLEEVFAAAEVWIDALPTRAEIQHNDFLKLVARTIEYGRDIGVDPDFVNPLEVMMKQLSENVIEDRRHVV